MLRDHRVAEEEAAALEGLTEDVELASRHCRDEPGHLRVETAERGHHLRGHANTHVRRAFAPVYTAEFRVRVVFFSAEPLTVSRYGTTRPSCMAWPAAHSSAREPK
jgi:hypothetical protein